MKKVKREKITKKITKGENIDKKKNNEIGKDRKKKQ